MKKDLSQLKPKYCMTELINECVLLARVRWGLENGTESWHVYHHIEKGASF